MDIRYALTTERDGDSCLAVEYQGDLYDALFFNSVSKDWVKNKPNGYFSSTPDTKEFIKQWLPNVEELTFLSWEEFMILHGDNL